MADFMTPEQRKRCMSRVRSRNTKPEILLRKELWRLGFRYRLKNNLPGRPDIIYPGKKLAIFVDGCFWHGCQKHGSIPKTNTVFWENKIQRNMERDLENTLALEHGGWTVFRLWEHEIKENMPQLVETITASLVSD